MKWNNNIKWNNTFSITVVVKLTELPFKMIDKVKQGLSDFGMEIKNDNFKLSVEEEICNSPGVYKARIIHDDVEVTGFAVWIVYDGK